MTKSRKAGRREQFVKRIMGRDDRCPLLRDRTGRIIAAWPMDIDLDGPPPELPGFDCRGNVRLPRGWK